MIVYGYKDQYEYRHWFASADEALSHAKESITHPAYCGYIAVVTKFEFEPRASAKCMLAALQNDMAALGATETILAEFYGDEVTRRLVLGR
jgi:hypothetical protein